MLQLAVHGLDQWNLLSDIIPFFTADLPYSISCRRNQQLSDLERVRLDNRHDTLFIEVGFIKLAIRPEYELNTATFQDCISAIVELLDMFECLLCSQMRILCENANQQTHIKLRTLQYHLIHAEDNDIGFDALDREFGGLVQFFQSEQQYKEAIDLVKRCNNLFDSLFSESKPALPYDPYETGLPTPWRKEPTYQIRDVALSLHELLMDKWPLDCYAPRASLPHQGKLRLNTWQASQISNFYAEFDMVFSTHTQPSIDVSLTDFDTLSERTRRPRFEPNEWESSIQNKQVHHQRPRRAKQRLTSSLCSVVNRPDRVHMPFDHNGKTWQISLTIRSQDTAYTDGPISLARLLEGTTDLNLMDKLVLAVILGHSFLHLCESPWLHQKWGKGDIFFFPRTSESAVDIHKPFVALRSPLDRPLDEEEDGACPHPYPSILSLGILLLEIDLGKTIASVRTAEDGQHSNSPLDTARRTASRILQSVNFVKTVRIGYRAAIQACLDCNFVPYGSHVSDVAIRMALYDKVVAPIEKELYDGWAILVDEPKHMVGDLQTPVAIPSTFMPKSAPELTLSKTFSASNLNERNLCKARLLKRKRAETGSETEELPARKLVTKVPTYVTVFGSHLFDDEHVPDAKKCSQSDKWFDHLTEFLEHFVFPVMHIATGETPIKIAILDTGIDYEHTIIKANCERIVKTRSWVNDGNDMKDVFGHGAHTLAMLLKVAPYAHVCVARVAEAQKLASEEDIVQAIHWAIGECDADIVSMSFGMPQRSSTIRKAINSYSGQKIFFAATHNDGGNRNVAYPAKLSKVIGISSTDGLGNSSRFNPSTQGKLSFSTLGEGIASEWLGSCDVRKSGTSYATPIAAAIAATFLAFVKLKLDMDSEELEKLHSCEGMSAMLKLMSKPMGEHSYVTPWSLWEGKPEGIVLGLIRNELDDLD
ncbi:uncharacterized protein PAC_06382 [Phialocephala subalpina]|uniref:Uncharacterized protein n=1 Tax=Phialocephala subalpina TaxID=576137 RepID=A0A1L7WUP0_9HELO|nr:uncharacterized protein PAC_06382 [Phialocephala subalpina]